MVIEILISTYINLSDPSHLHQLLFLKEEQGALSYPRYFTVLKLKCSLDCYANAAPNGKAHKI